METVSLFAVDKKMADVAISLSIVTILSSLRRDQIGRLDHPEDYFQGREKTPPACPANIILFHRRSVTELTGQHRDNYHHHRFVLIYCLEGPGTVLINDAAHPMKPGHACLIFPFELHFFSRFRTEGISWLFITFEAETGGLAGSLRNRYWAAHEPVERLIGELVACWSRNQTGLAYLLSLLLLALDRTPGASATPGASSTFLAVNRLLKERPDHAWTVAEVARGTGYSPGHLRFLFRNEVKISIGSYIRRYRVLRAARLLQATPLRIGEVADQCGFDSHFAFSRTFKQTMGTSPKAYRAQMMQDEERLRPRKA